MNKKIVLVIRDKILEGKIREKINFADCEKHFFSDIKQALNMIYEEIPNVVIVDTLRAPYEEISLINQLKKDPLFVSMTLIAIIPDDFICNNWENFLIDDYVRISSLESDFKMRVELSILRLEKVVATNPLTKLPGNLSIHREIQNRLDSGEIFSLAYADLDNFKPFNDKYGFSRGDEVIKILGRIIMNIVRATQPVGSFIGHIGGDDFVYIMSPELIESATIKIIEIFENLVKNFYDVEDLRKGFITSFNRKGERQTFPLMSVSVGITSNKYRKFRHFSEMAEVASEMKALAKKQRDIRYAIDRRRDSNLVKQTY